MRKPPPQRRRVRADVRPKPPKVEAKAPQPKKVIVKGPKKILRLVDHPRPPKKITSRRSGRARASDRRRYKSLAVMKAPNFSLRKAGNRYTLRAVSVTEGVLLQVRSFLRTKKGKPYVDGQRMTKEAAFRYISLALRKRAVQVVFRRR